MNFLGEVHEFEFASSIAHGGEGGHELADAGAVDVIDPSEVEEDLFLSLGEEIADGLAERVGFVAQSNAAADVEDGDVIGLAAVDAKSHERDGSGPDEVSQTGGRGVPDLVFCEDSAAADWASVPAVFGMAENDLLLSLLPSASDLSIGSCRDREHILRDTVPGRTFPEP